MFTTASVVLFILTLKMVLGLEPPCSPFHYQEQMIEKMVKLEIFVQKMKDDMTALQQQVKDEIEILKVDRKLIKSELETEKTSMNNAVQQVIKKHDGLFQNFSSQFQEMVETDSEEMRKRAKEVEAIKDSAVTPNVVFYAKDISNIALSNGVKFIYQTIVLNEGKGYNNTTGMFTAPVGGTYLFTVQFCLYGGSSHYLYYEIVSDGNSLKRGFLRSFDTHKSYTTDVIMILRAGAQVWVACSSSSSSSGSLCQNSDHWNTFSGVLLRK